MQSEPAPSPSIPFFDESAVRRKLHMSDLVPAMERALADFSTGRVVQPVRQIVPVSQHSGFMAVMPCVYDDVMGAKLVCFYPENGMLGLPTHLGLIVVFRAATGEPLAILDGRLITEMRTAAVTAVATKLLARRDAGKLAILGSGVQARAHYEALSLVRKFDEIRVWSRNHHNAEHLAAEIGAKHAASAEDAVREADVVVTVTSATEPVLHGRWLKAGALVNAVGAAGRGRREIDDSVLRGAVIVDSRDAALKESEEILSSGASVYAELGELLAGVKPLPTAEVTVFKSLGLAVEDIAAAKLVLEI